MVPDFGGEENEEEARKQFDILLSFLAPGKNEEKKALRAVPMST